MLPIFLAWGCCKTIDPYIEVEIIGNIGNNGNISSKNPALSDNKAPLLGNNLPLLMSFLYACRLLAKRTDE